MAQLKKPNSSIHFAAAASAVTLTTSRKLVRNFRYYKSSDPGIVSRDELILLCREARSEAFSMHNVMTTDEIDRSPFLVSLAGQIFDQLEELHRKLLFFDAESISQIIPHVDRQRSFWKNLTNPEFYSQDLIHNLEHSIPRKFTKIESLIEQLPASVNS